MRTLAIDLGTKRIGLAICDEEGRFASPLETIEVSSPDRAIAVAMAAISREQPGRLAVGVPLNMDGSIGPAAEQAIKWGRQLAAASVLPVVFVDERLSSFAAEQQLSQRKRAGEKLTHKRKKARLDAIAAAAFLQDYLDGKLGAIEAE